jgi:uncharacterized C2H2 Zn-finger protein
MTQLYKCPECGGICFEDEMDADYCFDGDGDEYWSNWICPHCGMWHQLEDYLKVQNGSKT